MHAIRTARRSLLALLFFGAGAFGARAEVLAADEVVLDRGDIVEGNFYASGGAVTIRGEIFGDAVIAGGEVTIDGDVHGDVLATGGDINVIGRVDGDVRVCGGALSVAGAIGGDVAFAGGGVNLHGPVAGDVFLMSGTANIDGDVDGTLYVGGGDVNVRSRITGGAVVQAGRLALHENALIDGDLWYTGDALERSATAVVNGEVIVAPDPMSATAVRGAGFVGWLQGVVGVSLFGLLWLLSFRSFAQRTMTTLRDEPGLSVGIGALALFTTPFVLSMILLGGVLLGGWWISIFGLALASAAIALGVPVVAALFGRELLMKRMKVKTEAVPMVLVIAALAVVKLVPVVGGLVLFTAVLFGVGALIVAAQRTLVASRRAPP